MVRGYLTIGSLAVALLVLAGCYGETSNPEYEPGVYKGKEDPLLGKQRDEELVKRFKKIQTDR